MEGFPKYGFDMVFFGDLNRDKIGRIMDFTWFHQQNLGALGISNGNICIIYLYIYIIMYIYIYFYIWIMIG